MPSLTAKERVSLCLFTFDDGRRCRAPRISTSPDFCFYHAKKESQLRATKNLADDLAYFFSSDYLSANDLNTALRRVFVAVARGDLKPRAARTLACLAQTMLQTLHLAQNEFITACGEKDWRHTVVESINANHYYRFPEPTEPAPPQPQTPAPAPARPQPDPQPPTTPPTPAPASTVPSAPPPVCHPERSEGPRLDSASPANAEIRAASQPIPEPNQPAPQTTKPSAPDDTQSAPASFPPRQVAQTRDPYAVHYGPNYRLIVDGKPF